MAFGVRKKSMLFINAPYADGIEPLRFITIIAYFFLKSIETFCKIRDFYAKLHRLLLCKVHNSPGSRVTFLPGVSRKNHNSRVQITRVSLIIGLYEITKQGAHYETNQAARPYPAQLHNR